MRTVMAAEAGANHLRMVRLTWLQAGLELGGVMAIYAVIGGDQMLGIFAQHGAGRNRVSGVMAREAGANNLRMINRYTWYEAFVRSVVTAFAKNCCHHVLCPFTQHGARRN